MVEDLRQWLGLSGKYPLFSDFRRRVLEQAEREINQYTPMQIQWQPIKQGKTVKSIRFDIRDVN
jgi:plasmid replication initiation protein